MIMLINAQFKNNDATIAQNKTRSRIPHKGLELLPRDSSRYELEVHNAILLYELVIDKMNMKQDSIAMKIESK